MEGKRICIGVISHKEAAQVERSLERLAGLEELLLIAEEEHLAARIRSEMENLRTVCEQWWATTCNRHHWQTGADCDWEIDFEQGKVWLIPDSTCS